MGVQKLGLLLLFGLVAVPGSLVQGQFTSRDGALPMQGQTLPEMLVFDERGQVFSTASLKGSYTVLVFGCLT